MSQEIFFTADLHLGHTNIIKYQNRPFSTSKEMDEVILDRFKSLLKPGDLLYILGDLAWSSFDFGPWLKRLPTKNLQLILGNHDKQKRDKYEKCFNWVGDIKNFVYEKQPFSLCHYPMRSWPGKGHGAIHLFGHTHGSLPGLDRSMDVGVDTNYFYPYRLEEVKKQLSSVPIYPEMSPLEQHQAESLESFGW